MKLIRNIRWSIADRLCRWANRLRGHEVVSLWHVKGNRAAELEEYIIMSICTADRNHISRDELNETIDRLHELAGLARATWWHE
jgi:hypothetical protein